MANFKPGDVGHLAEHDRISAELLALPDRMAAVGADPTSEFAIQQNATFVAGQIVSTDGTDGLPEPTGVGMEFVRNADGLDDIRFNGVSL